MANARRDQNRVPTLMGISSTDDLTPVPLKVNPSTKRLLVDTSGGAAGQQYTEGDTSATIVGTAILWEDASDTLSAVSSASPLPVEIVGGSSSGTQYTEGDTSSTIVGTAIVWEGAANTLVSTSEVAPLPVQIMQGEITIPSGASTEAKQDLIFAEVDAINDTVAAILTDTGSIDTNVADVEAGIGATSDAAATAGSTGSVNSKLRLMTSQLNTLSSSVVAHDSADSGNPLKVGAKAQSAISGITLVASGDRSDFYTDLDGLQIVKNHSALADKVSGNASNTDGSSTQVIAAQGAGIKTYITDVTITNVSSTNTLVELKDGTTTKWTFPAPANSGGVTHRFETPIAGTANTAWNFDPGTAATTIYCSAAGFKSKI